MATIFCVTNFRYDLWSWNIIGVSYGWLKYLRIKAPVCTRLTSHLAIKSRYVITDAIWILLLVYAGTGRIEYREPASSIRSDGGGV
jgi:hypothetical protein